MSSYRSKYDPMHSAKRAAYEAQGVPPALAMELAARDTLRAFQEDVAATLPREPVDPNEVEVANNDDLYARQGATRFVPRGRKTGGRILLDDDEAAFDASMADAMGQSNLSAAATPIAMEPELKPAYRRAPGPVSLATGEAEAGEDMYDPEAVEAYRTRVPSAAATEAQMARARRTPLYRDGQLLPSPEDEAMYSRGQVYTVNPVTGARGYSPAHPKDLPVGPGEPGRLGRRLDLEQPVVDPRTGQPIQGTQKYEAAFADSPFGRQAVYRPSDAFREQLDRQEQRKRVERLGSAAGMDDAAIVALASGSEPVDLEALRSAGRLRRESEREERLARVAQRAMERQNPMSQLNDEWRQYVLASQMLGRPAGASPTDVQARNLEVATGLAGRWGQGTGNAPGPEAGLIEVRTEAERRANTDPRELAREAAGKGEFNHSDVLNRANAIVDQHYSLVTPFGNTSGFLDLETHGTGEVEEAAQKLADETDMPYEEAYKIMTGIQRERNRNFNLSP